MECSANLLQKFTAVEWRIEKNRSSFEFHAAARKTKKKKKGTWIMTQWTIFASKINKYYKYINTYSKYSKYSKQINKWQKMDQRRSAENQRLSPSTSTSGPQRIR